MKITSMNDAKKAPHTPTPWFLDGEDFAKATNILLYAYISIENGARVGMTFHNCLADVAACRANAAFIVKACNHHDELVAALEAARQCLDRVPKLAESIDRLLAKVRA